MKYDYGMPADYYKNKQGGVPKSYSKKQTEHGVPLWLKMTGVSLIAIGVLVGSSFVLDALMYAGFAFLSMLFTWYSSSPKIRLFTLNHPVITDTTVALLCYFTMGTGVRAMFAAMIVGFGCNVFIDFANKHNRASVEKEIEALKAS